VRFWEKEVNDRWFVQNCLSFLLEGMVDLVLSVCYTFLEKER